MNKEMLDLIKELRSMGMVSFDAQPTLFTLKEGIQSIVYHYSLQFGQQQDFNSWNTQDIDNAELLRKLDEGNPLTSSEDDLIYHSSR
jgi:hypothetical protein